MCSLSIMCRHTHRTEHLKVQKATWGPARKIDGTGRRFLNGTTWMPFSSITITHTRGRIRCLTGDQTQKEYCTWVMDRGVEFENRPTWISARIWRLQKRVIIYPSIASRVRSSFM